jgi:cyclic-di-AMP phosphodiesterase PgpH
MNRKATKIPRIHRFIPFLRGNTPTRTRTILLFIGFFVAYLGIVYLNRVGLFSTVNLTEYEVGKVAERDLVVDHDVYYIDTDATRTRREAEARLVNPVFTIDSEITAEVLSVFERFQEDVTNVLNEGGSVADLRREQETAWLDLFERSELEYLLDRADLPEILASTEKVLETVQQNGVIRLPGDDTIMKTGAVTLLRRVGDREYETETSLQDLPDKDHITAQAERAAVAQKVPGNQVPPVALIVKRLSRENAFYDADETAHREEMAMGALEPVVRTLQKDETIVKEGFVITEEDMVKVRALGDMKAVVDFSVLAGTAILLLFLFILSAFLLNPPVIKKQLDSGLQYLLLGMSFLYAVMAAVIHGLQILPAEIPFSVLLPTSLLAMLVSILAGRRVGTFFVFLLAVSLFLVDRGSPYPFLFALFTAMVGSVIVSEAEKRIDLVRGSFILSGLSGLCVIPLGLFGNLGVSELASGIGWGVANGFLCGILNLGLLPFFEHMLNASTPFRLMELSDLNTPLFKRMITLAPGTYGHCISVANLAESAAREIGANPLLSRVGAYYHDIGKIDQAEYFIENQTEGNKHDELKPSLSAAVIKSHVKMGLEKGKELGLPKEVLEIITQHHGSGLISYFYVQALKKQGNTRINPEDFSYTGSPPMSREAAVVMLADTVEAASRTLNKPTVAKLEKFVWEAIMEKVTSGQLSKCDLTFRDLEMIKKTFVQILAGQFHSRIEYPDAKDNGRKAQGR